MKPTINEKLIAYLALLSGLCISGVAVYYSVVGLTAIFAAAAIPIIIMGTSLEVSKLVATVWLKNNWTSASIFVRTYLVIAIAVLMLITSMGIFGFLSKAHIDQNMPAADVAARVAYFDEKIKTGKDNIDANRKALKQMDEAVDQVMGRSSDEKGADKAVAVRKAQQKERSRLLSEITTEQGVVSKLNEERAPIAAEVRKVEAEVGPIKYIAAFFYGATDPTVLEKAVTWVIILLIIVFDPLAVMLLLASQISFQNFRDRTTGGVLVDSEGTIVGLRSAEGNSPRGTTVVVDTEPPTVTDSTDDIPVVEEAKPFNAAELWNTLLDAAKGNQLRIEPVEVPAEPIVLPPQPHVWNTTIYPPVPKEQSTGKTFDWTSVPSDQKYIEIDGQKFSVAAAKALYAQTPSTYIQNEEQQGDTRWKEISAVASDIIAERFAAIVRSGDLPFYKVPTDVQEQVKKLLQNGG